MVRFFIYCCALSLFVLFSCKKSHGDGLRDGKYFFTAEIDGKKIDITADFPSNGATYVYASAADQIQVGSGSDNCSDPGKYCFSFTVIIQGQKAGIYTSGTMLSLSVADGPHNYVYGNLDQALQININKIEHGTQQPGVLTGSFEGNVSEFDNDQSTNRTLPIHGSFAAPLF